MIIKEFQLNEKINPDLFQSFLIYGPNEGLVRENIDIVYQNFSDGNDCEKINLIGKQIDEDISVLNNELSSISMFCSKKFILLESVKDKHKDVLENIINKNFINVCMVIKLDNLSKSSKIRKLYEASKFHYSLACYEDDLKSLSSLIEKFQKENDILFNTEVKNYLKQILSNDRSVIKNELEKILLASNGHEVSLDKIKLILDDNISTNLQKVNTSIMFGKTKDSSRFLARLFSEGIAPIVILKSLGNYLNRIRKTQIELRKGKSFEEAINVLKPPVFWKEKSDFQRHCSQWPPDIIENKISELLNTEMKCMKNASIAKEHCEMTILGIAHNGKKYLKN